MKLIIEFSSKDEGEVADTLIDLAQGFRRKPYLLSHPQKFDLWNPVDDKIVGTCTVVATDLKETL